MNPASRALRKSLLMLYSLAALIAFSCDADAQTAGANDECPLGTPWTVACVRKYMITDEQLREAVAYNSLPNHLEKIYKELGADISPGSYERSKKRLSGIVQFAADQSFEMGVAFPDMHVGMLSTQAMQTKEGKNFVLVNQNAFRTAVLSDEGAEKLKLSLGRELSRIRYGDTFASAVADLHNHPADSREAGLRADLEGAGPLGAKNPIAFSAAIQDELRTELHRLIFLKGTTLDDLDANRLSDRDYKRISDEHQRVTNDVFNLSPWDRIMALRKEARLMSEYEQTHTVRSHADREAESKWLVAQILPEALRAQQ
jgi:hypothetical protein